MNNIQYDREIFDYISCPICKTNKFDIYHKLEFREFKDLKSANYSFLKLDNSTLFYFQKCNSCNLVITNPRLKEKYFKMCYNEAKSSKFNFNNPLFIKGTHAMIIESRQRKYSYLHDLLPCLSLVDKNKELSLLDYGCGFGYTLSLAEEFGIDSYGIEISEFRREYCKRLSLKVYNPEEYEEQIGNKKYDIIISQSVIEHVNDINEYIRFIANASKKGTILFILGLTPRKIDKERKKKSIRLIQPIEHINYVPVKTLDRLMKAHGFYPCKERDFSLKEKSIDHIKSMMRQILHNKFRFFPSGLFRLLYKKT